TNIFQLVSVWLVGKLRNRRLVAVGCGMLARVPLLVIGGMALTSTASVHLLMSLLFFFYFFGSIAGPSWNSWMKDLIPENIMGSYFARRIRLSQILNVSLSIVLALVLDLVKKKTPGLELTAYGVMFVAGGVVGISGALILSRAPEPGTTVSESHFLSLLRQPLKNRNFSRLLLFNALWIFSLNLATPFFTVYMIKSLRLPLSYIIVLSSIGLLSSIFTVRIWGRWADKYSNKTIIGVGGPLYVLCIVAWCFAGIYTQLYANLILLVLIHIGSGISTAGINLSLANIGLKLAPKDNAIVYLSTQNIIMAFFSSVAPLLGGILADFFTSRHLSITAQWVSPHMNKVFRLLVLHDWNFLFLIGALLALGSLQFLIAVQEQGEVGKEKVVRLVRHSIRSNLKETFLIGDVIQWHEQLRAMVRRKITGV
ncbi:MAG: MFS transporter, partial [Bacteroidetes bacterium]|nr:MFS transporter [Bacteroidota bacterium]